jgi:zinc transport system substrate-binding protein
MHLFFRSLILAANLIATAAVHHAAAAPRVVASIKPVHSLVAGVMDGIGTPTLLVKGGASPHSYAMKPSEARALRGADLVFWIGGALETFLPKTLDAHARKNSAIELSRAAGVKLIAVRHGRNAKDHDSHRHTQDANNMHLWLDPANAKAMATAILQALIRIDPEYSARYRVNAEKLQDRLDALDAALHRDLAGLLTTPYIVFHDAYPYFERRYSLNNVGTITVSPEARPGAKRVHAIRQTLLSAGAVCVFSEPQFQPALVQTIVRGTKTRIGVLDPLGADIKPGKEAYFTLLRTLANSFRRCLRKPA